MPVSTPPDQPAPPFYNIGGRIGARVAVKTSASSTGIKPNMGCPPTTNGDRASGLAPSRPLSAKAQKGVRTRVG